MRLTISFLNLAENPVYFVAGKHAGEHLPLDIVGVLEVSLSACVDPEAAISAICRIERAQAAFLWVKGILFEGSF